MQINVHFCEHSKNYKTIQLENEEVLLRGWDDRTIGSLVNFWTVLIKHEVEYNVELNIKYNYFFILECKSFGLVLRRRGGGKLIALSSLFIINFLIISKSKI